MSVTAVKPVKVRLDFSDRKVNSVKYESPKPDAGQPKPAMTAVYVSNEAFAALGEPESISITIEPA